MRTTRRAPTLTALGLVGGLVWLSGCAGAARRGTAAALLDDVPGAPTEPAERERLLTIAPETSAAPDPAGGVQAWGLGECLRRALAASERLAAGGETLYQDDTRSLEVITHMLPRLEFDLRTTVDSDPIDFNGSQFQPARRTEHTLAVRHTIDPRLVPAWRVAAATRRLDELVLRDARDRLLFDVAAAFYEVLGGERDVEAVRAARSRAEEQLRVLEAQRRAGLANEEDVLLASARLSEVDLELVEAGYRRDSARARLARLVGGPPPARLLDTLEVHPPPGDVEQLVARALGARADLGAARARVEVAGRRTELAVSELLPTIELGFEDFTRAEGGFQQFLEWSFVAELKWEFWDGGTRLVQVARAASVERQQEHLARAVAADVRLDVIEAALACAALDRGQTSREARGRAAAAAHELTLARRRAGEATTLDVLAAEEAREDAERNLERSAFARKLGALRLWLATGELVRGQAGQALLEASR